MKGDQHLRRNKLKRNRYRAAFGKCMNPDCRKYPYMLSVHHIIPLKQSGTDDYVNFIVLCRDCHHHNKLHRYMAEDRIRELLTYKFFMELHVIGVASDDEGFEGALIERQCEG